MSQDTMKQHGVFSWNELMTSDLEAAKAFYGELLGWTLQDIKSSDMEYCIAKMGDRQVAGLMTKPKDAKDMPVGWGAYITVDDVDARTRQAQKLGGKIYVEPRDIPDIGRFSVISDPQGGVVMLITYFGDKM